MHKILYKIYHELFVKEIYGMQINVTFEVPNPHWNRVGTTAQAIAQCEEAVPSSGTYVRRLMMIYFVHKEIPNSDHLF